MSEVVRAGLRLLENDEDLRRRKLAELDAALARGIADAEAGRVVPAEEVKAYCAVSVVGLTRPTAARCFGAVRFNAIAPYSEASPHQLPHRPIQSLQGQRIHPPAHQLAN